MQALNPCFLPDKKATENTGKMLAKCLSLSWPCTLFLQGNLGAGKTTFVRGFLKGCGYVGAVKSPTFTLVEEYQFPEGPLYHFDLYRIEDPEELELVGIREYCSPNAFLIIEWPEKGERFLPKPDFLLTLNILEEGRELHIEAHSTKAKFLASKSDFPLANP